MPKPLAPLAIASLAVLALAGCGSGSVPAADGAPESTVATKSSSTHKGVKNWAGVNESGTSFTVTTGVEAPSGVEEGLELMGTAGQQMSYIAVTVDNRQGELDSSAASVTFTTPDGELVEYTTLSKFLNYQEAEGDISVDAENRIIEIHNAFSGEDYKVAVGEKKTVILALAGAHPTEVTFATVNGSTSLAPSDTPAETDKATGAPEASESVGSNEALADLSGTTLKGNDIRFRIASPNYQKDVNAVMPEELQGSWGVLCSIAATEDQLSETGAATAGGHVWRSLKYAVPEVGLAGLNGEADYKTYEMESLAEGGDEKCVAVHAVSEDAAAKTDTATVGQYVGTPDLLNTVEVK